MRRIILTCLMLCIGLIVDAQYIPAYPKADKKDPGTFYWKKGNTFRHLEISLAFGTSGIGIDIAAPISRFVQVRMGYDYMLPIKKSFDMNLAGDGQAAKQYDSKGNRISTPFTKIEKYIYEQKGEDLDDHIVMAGKITMKNAKFLVDVFPFKYSKNWHLTVGVYYGPSEFWRADNDPMSDNTISLMKEYNEEYDLAEDGDEIKGYGKIELYPGDYASNRTVGLTEHKKGDPYLTNLSTENTVSICAKSNTIKPYLGLGYTGRLIKYRDDWKISAELGVMLWGGTPVQRLHDGTDLSKDVINVQGKMGHMIGLTEGLKLFPVLSVRFAKTIF